MKIKIAKNGDVIYSKGWKTLITNMDAKVDEEVFKEGASFSQTIYLFLFSKIVMNSVIVALFVSVLAFVICVEVREFRIYMPMAIKVSAFATGIFAVLLVFRSIFWKIF